jgi:hypothetical protein
MDDCRSLNFHDTVFSLETSLVADHAVLAEDDDWDVVRFTNLAHSRGYFVVLVKEEDQLGISDLLSLSFDELGDRADFRTPSNVRVHFAEPLSDSRCNILSKVIHRDEEIVSDISLAHLSIINNKEAGLLVRGGLAAPGEDEVLQRLSANRTGTEHDDAGFREELLSMRTP